MFFFAYKILFQLIFTIIFSKFRNYWRFAVFADEIDEDERREIRLTRILSPRMNYHLEACVFRQSFRVDIEVANQVEQLIGRYLHNTNINNALSPRQQILTALHFLGNDAQYHVNGYAHNVSKATVCRCIHRVCYLITKYIMPLYVRWPTVCRFIERDFYAKAGFPNVKGIIDGTLIHIDAPSVGEPAYVGRDNKHSINVILVSGPQNQFFFASAICPGSIHDARAIRMSELWRRWEIEGWRPDNDNGSILLGDSAYPLLNWLIPPVVRNVNARIRHLALAIPLFERVHRKTRFIVECSIGILKEEFPSLNYFRIRDPVRITNAIYTCVALHNMQNRFKRGSYEYDTTLNELANRQSPQNHDQMDGDGIPNEFEFIGADERQREILEYFSRIM